MAELRTIARHAGSVLAGQLAVMAYGVTDTIVAGRHSEQALAALSVGSAVYISVFVALMGVVQAQLPVWAELYGAGRDADIGRSVRQALYLCAVTSALGIWMLAFPGLLLRWTAVPEAMQGDVRHYLAVLALSLPAALLFRLYSTLNQSLGKPLLVTWLQIGSLLVKVPLSVWFAFGGLGLPAQGAAGCAWATAVVCYVLIATALWQLRTRAEYRRLALWRPIEKLDWLQQTAFLRLGVPAGLAILVEVTSFTLMALFIARQGVVAAAAHQIASNLAAVLYMVPLSLAVATSARVSYWLGAGDPQRARHAILVGFRLIVLAGCALTAIVVIANQSLAAIYTDQPAVVLVASSLLLWVGAYHLADGIQVLCVFVLRCYRVTLAPLVAYGVLLWGVGLAGGYWLAYGAALPASWVGQLLPAGLRHSPAAFWLASTLALALLAVTLPLILWRAARPAR